MGILKIIVIKFQSLIYYVKIRAQNGRRRIEHGVAIMWGDVVGKMSFVAVRPNKLHYSAIYCTMGKLRETVSTMSYSWSHHTVTFKNVYIGWCCYHADDEQYYTE